jgi:S-adenosylmethionine hydrolase
VPYFPRDTIFVCVVDPGVGTRRAAVMVETDGPTFIAPDNGILSEALRIFEPRRAWKLTRPQFFLPKISHTFHGRDIFAPVAAHLALGRHGAEMGEWTDPDLLTRRHVRASEGDLARIMYVDRFGNLVTDLRVGREVRAVVAGDERAPMAQAYAEVVAGDYLCIWGSFDTLEVSRSMGNAAQSLGLDVGDTVDVEFA